MNFLWYLAFLATVCYSRGEESSWTWGAESKTNEEQTQGSAAITDDLKAAFSEPKEQFQLNATEIDQVVDDILDSSRQGRNVDGFDEVYSDPSVQDALQKGDDGEARNVIKEKLCYLGLMKVMLLLVISARCGT